LSVEIKPESDLWPRDDEAVIGNAARFFSLSVDIFKKAIAPEEYWPVNGASDFGVLSIMPKRSVLDWDRRKKRLIVVGETQFDKTFWKTNGKITSIVDLYGAQLLLFPPGSHDVELPVNFAAFQNEKQTELSRSVNLKTIMLDFGDGRSFWVKGKSFKKSAYRGGYPVFSVTLPSDAKEFEEFTKAKEDE
jgi:hypothetical protein